MNNSKSNLLFILLSVAGFLVLAIVIGFLIISGPNDKANNGSVADRIAEANYKIDNEVFRNNRAPQEVVAPKKPEGKTKENEQPIQDKKSKQDEVNISEVNKLKREADEAKSKLETTNKMLADAVRSKQEAEEKAKSLEITKTKQEAEDKAKSIEIAKTKQEAEDKAKSIEMAKTKQEADDKAKLAREAEAIAKSIEIAKLMQEKADAIAALSKMTKSNKGGDNKSDGANKVMQENYKNLKAETAKLKQEADDKNQAKSIEISNLKKELENKAKLAEISKLKKEADDHAKSEEITKLKKEKTLANAELARTKKEKENKLIVPKQVTVDLKNNVKLELTLIPDGKFTMGSPVLEAGREFEVQQEVTISKSYYMGKYEVTQEQWEAVMGTNPSFTKGGKLPVTNVSWNDCQEFIRKLNKETGDGFRLPTENEWEYACRAGTTTAFSFGETILKEQANYDESKIKPVGTYKPNAFDLYDMHGNVWEWCEDLTRPESQNRIFRGGSFKSDEIKYLRSFHRFWRPEVESDSNGGFRLAKTK